MTISKHTREAVYVHAEGKSALSGAPLDDKWELDHSCPRSAGGSDDVTNLQAVTADENRSKSNATPPSLRDWQREFISVWDRSDSENFLLVALPGSGKTIAALTVAAAWIREDPTHRRVVIIVPTDSLRTQWQAEAAQQFGLQFQTKEFTSWKRQMVGAIVTYQLIASSPELWKLRCRDERVLVICDEIHHAGDNDWGAALREAVGLASRRLLMSGTPFRGDSARIPFVSYDGAGVCVPGYRYDYPKAIRDGVIRVVRFQHERGIVRRLTGVGEAVDELSSGLSDDAATDIFRPLLQVGQYTEALLRLAHTQLMACRQRMPNAGGLVLCIDQAHAERIAKQLASIIGSQPDLIISDDERTTATVDDFRQSSRPWVVAVRQISEGVDIKRLMVLAYVTTYKSELFFRQAVGRIVRNLGTEADTEAYCFIPDHPVLVRHAQNITNAQAQAIDEESDREFRERNERLLQPQLFPDIILGTAHSGTAGTIIEGMALDPSKSAVVQEVAARIRCSELIAARFIEAYGMPSNQAVRNEGIRTHVRPLENQLDDARKAVANAAQRAAYRMFPNDDEKFAKANQLARNHIGKDRKDFTLEDCRRAVEHLNRLTERVSR